MTLRQLTAAPGGTPVIVAVAVGVALVLWSLVDAIRLDAVPEGPPLAFATAEALAPQGRAARVDVYATVQRDLFAPDREAPPERYRIPGEDDPTLQAEVVEAPKPVVLGTAISDRAHSFATAQLEGGPPTIVRVGDHIGDYYVKTITKGHVVFVTTNGTTIDIPALKPGS